jgi:hypothetical protein
MLEGLEILIARMDTNPDEFINGEWDYFLEDHPLHSDIFTEEELQAYDKAKERLREFKIESRRRFFTQQVVTRLMERYNSLPVKTSIYNAQNVQDIFRSGVEVVMEKEWERK